MKTHSVPRSLVLGVTVAAALVVLPTHSLGQGNLTPPGPPGPTMKTLQQVEPRTPVDAINTPGDASFVFVIDAPGSYYLAGDVEAADSNGILISAPGVTLDLNGFEVRKVSGTDGLGISITDSQCSIHNGQVRGFHTGIRTLNGARLRLRDLTISDMTGDGIRAFTEAQIENCQVYGVDGIGIFTGIVAIIRNCTVRTTGSHGIQTAETSIVEGNILNNNFGDSILADNRCTIRNNTCDFPPASGAGIHLTSNQGESRVENNNIMRRAVGIRIDGPDNYVSGNTVRHNGDNYDFAPGNFLNLLLSQIPESIDWPAKVKLAGTLRRTSGTTGITVQSDHVTIDLDGHALIGGAGSASAIHVPGLRHQLTIRNGFIRDWGGHGIDVEFTRGGSMENIHSVSNGWYSGTGSGIKIGSSWSINQCSATGNLDAGFDVGGGTLSDCHASGNGGAGIEVFSGGKVTSCTVLGNGADGINAGSGTTVEGCSAFVNSGDGIELSVGGSIVNCSATENDGDGFVLLYGGTITGSTSVRNDGTGIRGIENSTIKNCSATENGGDGIKVTWRSLIKDCTASSNDGDGIEVSSDCQVRDNNCSRNGPDSEDGAGILATSDANHIEGNSVTANDRGIDVDSFINLIIRNSARVNGTNYSIVPGNAVGPIISSGAVGANQSPHANFDYNL